MINELDREITARAAMMKKTSHLFHFILSLITGGVWMVVWIICCISTESYNRELWRIDPPKQTEPQEQTGYQWSSIILIAVLIFFAW